MCVCVCVCVCVRERETERERERERETERQRETERERERKERPTAEELHSLGSAEWTSTMQECVCVCVVCVCFRGRIWEPLYGCYSDSDVSPEGEFVLSLLVFHCVTVCVFSECVCV